MEAVAILNKSLFKEYGDTIINYKVAVCENCFNKWINRMKKDEWKMMLGE